MFSSVTCVTTVVSESPKILKILREIYGFEVGKTLSNSKLETRQGLVLQIHGGVHTTILWST